MVTTASLLIETFMQLGPRGKPFPLAGNAGIYEMSEQIAKKYGRTLPEKWCDEIRQCLQAHCIDSPQYRPGNPNLFFWAERGYWGLRPEAVLDLSDF